MAMGSKTFYQAATMVVKRVYEKTARKMPSLWQEIFNVAEPDPKRSFWTVLPITELGLLNQRNEFDVPNFDQAYEGLPSTFVFVNRALAYRFSKQAKDEDVMGVMNRLPKMLAYSEQIDKEINFWNIINQAYNASVLGADGLPLASTAHPLQKVPGVTVSNSAGAVALSPESLQNAFINFMTLLSDRGNPSYRTPMHLWIPPQLQVRAEEILGSSHYPYTDQNRVNVQKDRLELHVSRYITSSTMWVVTSDKGDLDGDSHSMLVAFKYQNEQDTWEDKATKTFNHGTEYRAAWGWVDWRGTYFSQGA